MNLSLIWRSPWDAGCCCDCPCCIVAAAPAVIFELIVAPNTASSCLRDVPQIKHLVQSVAIIIFLFFKNMHTKEQERGIFCHSMYNKLKALYGILFK